MYFDVKVHYSALQKHHNVYAFFLMRKWPSGKVSVTVSKFNAYFPHITGWFHVQICAVFSLTNVNVMSRCHNFTDSVR